MPSRDEMLDNVMLYWATWLRYLFGSAVLGKLQVLAT